METSHQDPSNDTKKFLKTSTLLNTSIYQQEMEVKIIDHIIKNIPNKILCSKVLPYPSISDHDAPYIIAKVPTNAYQSRYKFIRNMKSFDLQKYIDDFK